MHGLKRKEKTQNFKNKNFRPQEQVFTIKLALIPYYKIKRGE